MDKYEKEYREFGPWILEIKSEEDVPDLFKIYYSFDNTVERAIKLPIPLERRKAKKGMDLYKSIVSFNNDEIIIIENSKHEITVESILYKNINAIRNMVDLLEAEITIFTQNKNHSIKYNSVSEEMMNSIIDILRKKYTENKEKCRIESEFRGEITDQLFRNLINISRKKETLLPLSFRKTSSIKKTDMTLRDYIFFNFSMELQGYIFLKTDKEFVAVNRNKEIKKKRAVDYSYNYTYIPFENIESVEFIPDPEFVDVYILIISLQNSDPLTLRTLKITKEDFSEILDIYS